MMDRLFAILAWSAFVLAALSVGAALLYRSDDDLTIGERMAIAFLLGSGILGTAIFLVGLVRLNRAVLLACGIAAMIPMLFAGPRKWLLLTTAAATRRVLRHGIPHVLVTLLLFVSALPRPTGDLGNDAISYHLLGPVVWLRHGRIAPVPDASLTAFPSLQESIFAGGIAFSSDRFPGLVGVSMIGAFVVLVHGLALVLGGRTRWPALMSLLALLSPAITSHAASAFVDAAYAAYALAVARLLLAPLTDRRRLAFGGLLLGFCIATKYTGLSLTALTVLVMMSSQLNRTSWRYRAASLATVAAIALVVGCPAYLRNLFVFGLPIYPPPPLLLKLFPHASFPYEAAVQLQAYIRERGHGFGRGGLDLLLLPWRYTLHTSNFHGAGGVGVVPLALGPIGALAAPANPAKRRLLVWSGLLLLAWFYTQQESRFIIHVIGVGFSFAALGSEWLVSVAPRLGRTLVAVAAVLSGSYGGAVLAKDRVPEIWLALSPRAEAFERERRVPYFRALAWLETHRRSVRKVLVLGDDVPSYYLVPDYVRVRIHDGGPLFRHRDVGTALAAVWSMGVTHVLVPEHSGCSLSRATERFPALRLAYRDDSASILQVVPPP